jgi:hypothetical protein
VIGILRIYCPLKEVKGNEEANKDNSMNFFPLLIITKKCNSKSCMWTELL